MNNLEFYHLIVPSLSINSIIKIIILNSNYFPKLFKTDSPWWLFNSKADLLWKHNPRYFWCFLTAASHCIGTFLCRECDCRGVASIYDLEVVFNFRHRLGIGLNFLELDLDSEVRVLAISLEEVCHLSEDLIKVVYSEAENISTWKFWGLNYKCSAIFTISNFNALNLNPREGNIKVLSQLCKPNNPHICEIEGA